MFFFISAVALLVKVTASMFWYAKGFMARRDMYSTASVKVLPEPADALYIWRDVGVLVLIVGFYLYAKLRIRFYMTKCFGGYLVVCQRFLDV